MDRNGGRPAPAFASLMRTITTTQAKLADPSQANFRTIGPLWAALESEEVWTSMRLAASPLDRVETDALVRRGVAMGGHRLEAYIAVEDYRRAALFARDAHIHGRRVGLLSVEEIVGLHARVAARSGGRPGALRAGLLGPLRGGIIAPPPWLLPQALAAYVERVRLGPPAGGSPLAWIADTHARYERLHPFDAANGRVGRCLVNLLLRRLGYVAFILAPRDARAYRAALHEADARNPWPLAAVLARSLARTYALLCAEIPGGDDTRPLSEFAAGKERAALYKAAQRGRLRSFRRAGRLQTSAAWIAEYRA